MELVLLIFFRHMKADLRSYQFEITYTDESTGEWRCFDS